MKIIPNSSLYLCENVELDPNNEFTIDFNDINEQYNYFYKKITNTFDINDGYNFIKTNETLKIYANIEDLININYMYFRNDTKIYYCFITRKNYISENCTELEFEIDVLQTFMFDYEIQESFINREHQDRLEKRLNGIYAKYNIENENIDVGTDYNEINEVIVSDTPLFNDKKIIWLELISTQPISKGNYSNSDSGSYKFLSRQLRQFNISSGIYAYFIPISLDENKPFYTYAGTGEIVKLNNYFEMINESTAVLAIRILHNSPIKYNIKSYSNGYLISFDDGYKPQNNDWDNTNMRVVTYNNNNFGGVDLSSIGGYVFNLEEVTKENINDVMFNKIINKKYIKPNINELKNIEYETKLNVYPYKYIELTDHQSNPFKIQLENINEDKNIIVRQSLGIQSKLKIFVENYNNENGKQNNTINNGISELPLKNDAYISYMAQNKASATSGIALNIGTSLANLGLGAITGGVGLAVAGSEGISVANDIANHLIKMRDLKATPDSVRQTGNNAEFDIIDDNYKIRMGEFEIKPQMKTKLFNYFTHFGYACNDFKIPNIKSRYYYNYIKTIGINLKSNIDNEYIEKIKNIYNKGVTFWHFRDINTFKGINNYDFENVEMNLLEEEIKNDKL